jgi:hypothetical protein
MPSARGTVSPNRLFDWTNAVVDASIMAGIGLVTTLTGLGVAGLSEDPEKVVLAAGLAAALAFLTTLSLKRGLTSRPAI